MQSTTCEKEEEADRESKWEFKEKSYQIAVYTNIFTRYLRVSTKKSPAVNKTDALCKKSVALKGSET